MRRIFKYELTVEDVQVIETFTLFEPLSVKVQKGTPVLYAIVDDETVPAKVRIRTYGTGFAVEPYTPPNPRWQTADVMYTKNDDGLSKEWFGRVFLNPPYSRPLVSQFMEKMAAHGNGIALVVPKLGTKMFREVVYPACSAI